LLLRVAAVGQAQSAQMDLQTILPLLKGVTAALAYPLPSPEPQFFMRRAVAGQRFLRAILLAVSAAPVVTVGAATVVAATLICTQTVQTLEVVVVGRKTILAAAQAFKAL
jgi:hypothetical protein